jgi:flagellin
MPQIINTNILTLNAQRNLNRTQGALQTSLQRLSSGLRVNSAKDDAAGIAVAARMTTQIGGLSAAVRNANDGISIAQTAEGAIGEMVTSLNRMHDLAVQAASYNTDADRSSLNEEVSQLIDELSRIVNQTRYNGQKLLTGGFSADIQVGAAVNETINLAVSNLSPTSMGVASNYSAITALSSSNLADRLRNQFVNGFASTDTINSVQIGSTVAADANSVNKIDAINAKSSTHGVTAFGYGNSSVGTSNVTDANLTATAVATGDLVINGISIDGATGLNALRDNINAKTGQHGVTAVVDAGAAADQNRLVLYNTGGSAVTLTVNSANAATVTGFASGTKSVDAGANGLVVLNQKLGSTSVTFNTAAVGESMTGVNGASATLTDAPVNAQVVTSAAAANLAMLSFEKALDSINSSRAVLGAKLNRMESVIRNLENVTENISAARSRIQDADFAAETANLTRGQILQQAGVAMVAQANALPQTVLALLQ